MKKLLSTLSIVIIGSSSSSAVVNNVELEQKNETYAKEFFWNAKNVTEIWNLRTKGHGLWTESPQMAQALYTFNLGSESNFKTFTFLEATSASVVWGNNTMGTWQPPQSFAINFDAEHNKQITSIDDINFYPYLKMQIFDKIFNAVLASLVARTYIGYTWYTLNNEYYFQFLLFEYINVRSDYSAAYNEINLGRKFSLS